MIILLAAVVLSWYGARSFSGYFADGSNTSSQIRTSQLVGQSVSIEGLDWKKSRLHLIVVLSQSCGFCIKSMPFYRSLAQHSTASGVPILAFFVGGSDGAKTFLDEHQVPVDLIVTPDMTSIRITATPTVLLVDTDGKVVKQWMGMLDKNREQEVIATLGSKQKELETK